MNSTQHTSSRAADAEKLLQDAYQKALAFPLAKISALTITQKQANDYAEQEAAQPTITIDEHGMSGGMRVNLLQPVRAVAAEWRQLRSNFETALQPKIADIQAVEALQAAAEAEIKRKDDEIEGVERELRIDAKYARIDEQKRRVEGTL